MLMLALIYVIFRYLSILDDFPPGIHLMTHLSVLLVDSIRLITSRFIASCVEADSGLLYNPFAGMSMRLDAFSSQREKLLSLE
jgi:hypothetical protein